MEKINYRVTWRKNYGFINMGIFIIQGLLTIFLIIRVLPISSSFLPQVTETVNMKELARNQELLLRAYQVLIFSGLAFFLLMFVTYGFQIREMVGIGSNPIKQLEIKSFINYWKLLESQTSNEFSLDKDMLKGLLNKIRLLLLAIPIVSEELVMTEKTAIITCDISDVIGDFSLPKHIPMIFVHPRGILEQTFLEIITVSDKPLQFLAFLVILGDQELFDWKSFKSNLRRKFAIELIIFTSADLENLIFHTKLIEVGIRRFILQQINLTLVSPYVNSGPISGGMFFGREKELRDITLGVMDGNFIIIGGRRIGKTSLLTVLHNERLPNNGYCSLYLDCSSYSSYESFLQSPIHNWKPFSPKPAVLTLGEVLESSGFDLPLVILLDEIDKTLPYEKNTDWKFLKKLRSWTNQNNTKVILCGERTLNEELLNPISPLFNFGKFIKLGLLDFKSSEELVIQPFERLEILIYPEDLIVGQIIEFTGGHPNIIQRLCNRLIDRLNSLDKRELDLDDLNAIIADPTFQREDFLSTFWESSTPLERIISLIMAENPNINKLVDIRTALRELCSIETAANIVDNALQRLVDLRSILKRTPQGYIFLVKAFPNVIAGTVTSKDMLEILIEEFRRTPQ